MRGLVSSIWWWVFLVPVMIGMVPACGQRPDSVNPFPGGTETVTAYPPPTETGNSPNRFSRGKATNADAVFPQGGPNSFDRLC